MKPLVRPWTVTITLSVWPDKEDEEPIVDAIDWALRPLLGRDETMHIELRERD